MALGAQMALVVLLLTGFNMVLVQGVSCPQGTSCPLGCDVITPPLPNFPSSCNVCAAGYGATLCSRTMCRSGDGLRKTGETLTCTACKTGYYNTGKNIKACQKCACSQPPVCKVYKSCVATTGCVWDPALDGTVCPLSPTENGICKSGNCEAEGVELFVKFNGVALLNSSELNAIAIAAAKALGMNNYSADLVRVSVVASSTGNLTRHRRLLSDVVPTPTRSKLSSRPQAAAKNGVTAASAAVTAASTTNIYTIIRIVFLPSGSVTRTLLQSVTAPSGQYMAYLRNELPPQLFPNAGGSLQQCGSTTTCSGTIYVVIQPIATCDVAVCFLMDGSGSIFDVPGAWDVEANVVDSIARTIGDPNAVIAILEFSDSVKQLVPPATKVNADTSKLRTVNYQKGGTDMTAGINACKNLLATDPLMSGTHRSKVLVLLTDGGPNNAVTTSAAAAAAKASGITLITVGVGSANLAYMDSLSSGAGYAYSAAAFNNDATNLGVQITPAVCTSAKPYTECRQVVPTATAITMRQRPCSTAPSLGVTIPACERFEYLALARPRVSECAGSGDFSCWIEVIYNGMQGWIPSGSGTSCGGGSNPSDTAYVAYCPANGCPVQVPPTTCRQVVTNETITMKEGPCYGANPVTLTGTAVQLVRGDTFTFNNTDSKQTSMCGTYAASDPVGRTLCWVQAVFKGSAGWLPIGRGTFTDAFCLSAPEAAEAFVTETCAQDAHVQCRQVIADGGLDVFMNPCSGTAKVTKLAKCQQFDFIYGSKIQGTCDSSSFWIQLRYLDAFGRLQLGWVMTGSLSAANVDYCPSGFCDTGQTLCRQVTSAAGAGMWQEPCWSPTNTLIVQLQQWSTFDFVPGSKQTSLCSNGLSDGLCWVKGSTTVGTGWIPIADLKGIGTALIDSRCGTAAPGISWVRSTCDLCAASRPTCDNPPSCMDEGTCNPATGTCSYTHRLEEGSFCEYTTSGSLSPFLAGQCSSNSKCVVYTAPPATCLNNIGDKAVDNPPWQPGDERMLILVQMRIMQLTDSWFSATSAAEKARLWDVADQLRQAGSKALQHAELKPLVWWFQTAWSTEPGYYGVVMSTKYKELYGSSVVDAAALQQRMANNACVLTQEIWRNTRRIAITAHPMPDWTKLTNHNFFNIFIKDTPANYEAPQILPPAVRTLDVSDYNTVGCCDADKYIVNPNSLTIFSISPTTLDTGYAVLLTCCSFTTYMLHPLHKDATCAATPCASDTQTITIIGSGETISFWDMYVHAFMWYDLIDTYFHVATQVVSRSHSMELFAYFLCGGDSSKYPRWMQVVEGDYSTAVCGNARGSQRSDTLTILWFTEMVHEEPQVKALYDLELAGVENAAQLLCTPGVTCTFGSAFRLTGQDFISTYLLEGIAPISNDFSSIYNFQTFSTFNGRIAADGTISNGATWTYHLRDNYNWYFQANRAAYHPYMHFLQLMGYAREYEIHGSNTATAQCGTFRGC